MTCKALDHPEALGSLSPAIHPLCVLGQALDLPEPQFFSPIKPDHSNLRVRTSIGTLSKWQKPVPGRWSPVPEPVVALV